MVKPNRLIYHNTVSAHATLAIDLAVAAQLGFDGLELLGAKARAYLDAGHSDEELSHSVETLDIPGMGFLIDIERPDRDALLAEAAGLFTIAKLVGAKGVQVLTGPLDVRMVKTFAAGRRSEGYSGLLGRDILEQIRLTAANMRVLADLAHDYGLLLYLEALAWTPLNTIDKQLAVIDQAERDNVRMVIDFWHCYASGDTPDRVAKVARNSIYGVHVCDSLHFDGGIPDEAVLRDVATGKGVLKLADWVQAVKATGYDDWWSCELFSRRQRQQNSFAVASELKDLMAGLIGTA